MDLPTPDFRNEPFPDGIDRNELPEVLPDQYPNNATTENERLRFRLSLGMARKLFPGESDDVMVWQTAHTIYNDPHIRTGF